MKKLIITIIALLVFGLTLPAFAGKGNMKEAGEQMRAGMYEAACNTLEAEIDGNGKIKGNPLNSEAHFALGECYLYLDPPRMIRAKERFRSAVKLNSKITKKVAPAYKKAGEQRLNDGDPENARQMFNQAMAYEPAIGNEIASVVLAYGKKHTEDFYLSLAVQYNPGFAWDVAEFYSEMSKNTEGEPSLIFIKKADEFSGGTYKAEVAEKALEVCDNKSRPDDRKTCIDRNSDYLSPEQIFESSVRFYTNLWGPPMKVVRLEGEEWKEICVVRENDRIHYLSSEYFLRKDDDHTKVWEPWLNDMQIGKGNRFYGVKPEGEKLYFHKYEKPTMVYVWIEREGKIN